MLVTLEGLDGSGKTTVVRELKDRYPEAMLTKEPTDSWYGDAVRRSIGDPEADALAELFLYTADHAAHLSETVEPALAADKLVISDRYLDSRIAYQGATLADRLEDAPEFVRRVHEPFTIVPDLTIYLDVDVETAVARSDGQSKFEREDFLAEVKAVYERLVDAEPDRFEVIDATMEAESVCDKVVDAIESRLA